MGSSEVCRVAVVSSLAVAGGVGDRTVAGDDMAVVVAVAAVVDDGTGDVTGGGCCCACG